MQIIYSDLLCIGAGLAGERVAVEAAKAGFNVTCLSIVPPRRSHSSAAQGGMQAALGNAIMGDGDTPDVHFADTVKGSDWGCDQEVARIFADTAPIVMREVAHWGVPWNRVEAGVHTYYKGGKPFEAEEKLEKHGLIHARAFGGTAKWRTCYTADGTGRSVLNTLDSMCLRYEVGIHDRTQAETLIHDGENCLGAIVRCLKTGELKAYLATATLIATGGYGRIYKATTNAVICDGGGQIAALDTGLVPMGNMEAIQFHPTGTVPTDILVTEGCRGDGGTLLDVNEYRFMPDYEPEKAELASRDVVSRRMQEHIRKGLGVKSPYGDHLWLDIRHLGEKHITTKLREVYDICTNFLGVNPIHDLIPVRPTQHYSMGGIRTNRDGAAYGLKGLFSAGESACWDMHGFNRLGGNSLAETVVAGRYVGKKIVEFLKGHTVDFKQSAINDAHAKVAARIMEMTKSSSKQESAIQLRDEMHSTMMDNVGIFRNGKDLQKAVDTLDELIDRSKNIKLQGTAIGFNPEISLALRIPGMLKLAQCTAYGALMRTESRGAHTREDFPERNDKDWLNRTLAYWKEGSTRPELKYEDASPYFEIPPGERGYGGGKIIAADIPEEKLRLPKNSAEKKKAKQTKKAS
ncbi:fumarate reductase flavoprotein subunit [Halodesulfovibrio spirochaetisodalis]|uniref:succinate dehydrogenase n=1 Tax=Halodesulfovibrio spirochaetisodalis TaxID=1560234 RepID=A0A1B7XB91_9BACT|nr:fumarate reductase flavoprotein subunit [Halodesulfovibrio spirochaetisodalis]OBQ46606.1 fumarate reductase [Halodesulfovibrio spirochaetisodalis]